MTTLRPMPAPLDRPIRLGVLISGGGTTLVNFIEKIAQQELAAEIALVISSREDATGVERANEAGLPCEVVSRGGFSSATEFSRKLFDLLREADVELVTLAGFLSLIHIPDDFIGRVMNIHPALIPSFCGRGFFGHKVHEAALDRGVKVSGCTVHFADNEYDHGPIVLQQSVPVLDDDMPNTLAARVFKAECEAYPAAVRLFAEGRLEIADGRVRSDG